jgi:HK97 family phage prohead protease
MELRAATTEAEEKNFVVEGYATTFGDTYELFRDGDYIVKENVDRNAFANTDMSDVVFQIDHEGRVYARTRNGSLGLEIDEHGLKTRTDLGLTSGSREVYDAIQAGLYDRMSFAFTVTKDSFTEEARDDGTTVLTRTILEVGKLYDVSAVSFPANPYTDISARSKDVFDGEIKRIEAERLHREEIRKTREAILARLGQEVNTND